MSVPASLDFVSIATNAGVFLAAVGSVVAAIWTAVKKIKSVENENTSTSGRLVGGAILDNASMLMWSESNREVADVLRETTREMMELRFAVTSLKEKIK